MGKPAAQKQQLKPLEMDELIAKAWRFVRERFRSYQLNEKSRPEAGTAGGMHHGSVMISRRACVSN
jgi:hypothetical protein